jgi:MtaA/CmuA family methyltransferase
MNGYERIRAALSGERPDKVPVMLHNFRMAARENGVTMKTFREDPHAAALSFIRAAEKYRVDGILVDIDTATLAGAAGAVVDLPEDEPARVRAGCIEDIEMTGGLPPVDITGDRRVGHWLETVRLLAEHFSGELMIRGNCDQAPFSLASMLRSPGEWLMDLVDPEKEDYVLRLLERCTGITGQFIRLMAGTGAHMVSNGDSPAGPEMISPVLYRKFALPYERQVVQEAREAGMPYVLHICGNTGLILKDMISSGADALELDQRTNIRLAHNLMRGHCAFFGNIDPVEVLVAGTPAVVEERTRALLEVFSDTPRFVLGAGCALAPETPEANLRAMIETARNF